MNKQSKRLFIQKRDTKELMIALKRNLHKILTNTKFRNIILWLIILISVSAAVSLFTHEPLLFYDWDNFFEHGKNIPMYYPPWTKAVVSIISLPALIGVTLASFSLALFQRTDSIFKIVIAFINLPLIWVLFLGQIDGLALLGILVLPWLAPLVIMKPQIAFFAIFANKKSIIISTVFFLFSLVIWGLWPIKMFSYNAGMNWPSDISLGFFGIPLFLWVVYIMPKEDLDWWLLAGTLITPSIISYNLLPLMPAVARIPKKWALIAVLTSWLPFSANWLGPIGWKLGWVSIAAIGIGLWRDREPNPDMD